MIKTTNILLQELKEYKNPNMKITNMVKKKELFPIIRGYYETNKSIPGHYLASTIYGPSYLSFEFALSYFGLIPEAVYHFTSASFNKRKRKKYETSFGVFTYRDVPMQVFNLATQLFQENGYSFILALPEKALCDVLYTYEPCANQKELEKLLFVFLRIDSDQLKEMNFKMLLELAGRYRVKNLKLLQSYIRKEIKNANDIKSID